MCHITPKLILIVKGYYLDGFNQSIEIFKKTNLWSIKITLNASKGKVPGNY